MYRIHSKLLSRRHSSMEHYFLGHVLNDILDKNIFGNSDIKFNRNPLPVFTYSIPWVHLTINYCVDKFILFTFDKSVYVNHFHPLSLLFKQHTFLSIWFGLLSQKGIFISNHSPLFYISLVPPHFTMIHVRSLCLI
jgi:hypothetical protein